MTIHASNLSFTYAGAGAPALQGLDFAVEPGEIFGFLGPSGAGKSTTQKILIGLLHNYQGEVTVLGMAPRAWGAEYYERIGVSFEYPNHYLKLTALENLATFGALYRGPTLRPRALLEAVALGEHADRRVGQFSKGMKARLSIARSLLHDPELLFWDEPTAGLDPMNARRIKDLALEQKARGKTIFLTTHFMEEAETLCERICIMDKGQIVTEGSADELKHKHEAKNLEDVFLKTTGSNLGDEDVNTNAADPYSRSRM